MQNRIWTFAWNHWKLSHCVEHMKWDGVRVYSLVQAVCLWHNCLHSENICFCLLTYIYIFLLKYSWFIILRFRCIAKWFSYTYIFRLTSIIVNYKIKNNHWSLVGLKYCASFRCTTKWISYILYIYNLLYINV